MKNTFWKKHIKFIYLILLILMVICNFFSFTNISFAVVQYRENTILDEFDSASYPGYIEALKEINKAHPNWTFTFLYTGLSFDEVIYNETLKPSTNLIQGKNGEWVNNDPIALNEDGSYVVYEGTNWYSASIKAISYYLDPRNFLNEKDIFQFERLSFTEDLYSIDGIEKIIAGTFMSNISPKEYYGNDNYSDKKFSEIIFDAGKEKNISPYHLASRIKQEIIVSGGGPSGSVSGKVEGYEGIYNFYNLGATTGQGAITRGLIYANNHGWYNPTDAIIGGAEIIGKSYISIGQDTVYLEKFNVDATNGVLFTHQYQANIQAPYHETLKMYSTYLDLGLADSAINFIIPVYENMPFKNELPNNEYSLVTENVITNTSNVNIRSDKSTFSAVIAKANYGDVFVRIEKGLIELNGYIWDKIVLENGTQGYIASKYLDLIDPIKNADINACIISNTNIRNGPGFDGTSIIQLGTIGKNVTILENDAYIIDGIKWTKILLDNGTAGYIESSELTTVLPTIEGDIVKISTSVEPLNIREYPGTSNKIILKIPKNSLVIRLEENVLNDDISNPSVIIWDKIKTFDGIIGYASREYLTLVIPKLQYEESGKLQNIKINEENKYLQCEALAIYSNLLAKNANIKLYDKDNNIITDVNALLATGQKVDINGVMYTVIKPGDINGDGKISSKDYGKIKNHIMEVEIIKGDIYKIAADVKMDGKISSGDYGKIKNHIMETEMIGYEIYVKNNDITDDDVIYI